MSKLRVCMVTSHPIQYQAPWFRALAGRCDLKVLFCHRPGAVEQGEGFGKKFEWDVDLLSGYDSEFLTNISMRPGSGRFWGCNTPEVAARIRDGGFDAVILSGWYLKSYLQALRACRQAGVPVLVRGDSQLGTPRSRIKTLLKDPVYRWLLGKIDGFLAVGTRNREYLRHYGVPAERIFSAPHFVDNDWFASRAESPGSSELAATWGKTSDGLVALFVGKFIGKKRPDDILRAVARILECGSVTVVFVGSGELEGELRDSARQLGIDAVFAGFKNQSELPACYAAADVLVLPSDGGETWGLVVNEAMACGIPAVVSSACGCAPDLIDEGETGFTYPTGDVEALAGRLREMLQRKRAGHAWAPALVRKMRSYSVSACVDGTLSAVRQLTNSSRK